MFLGGGAKTDFLIFGMLNERGGSKLGGGGQKTKQNIKNSVHSIQDSLFKTCKKN